MTEEARDLHIATEYGELDTIRQLLDGGVSVEALCRDRCDFAPLLDILMRQQQ
jgi:hypothetical protein